MVVPAITLKHGGTSDSAEVGLKKMISPHGGRVKPVVLIETTCKSVLTDLVLRRREEYGEIVFRGAEAMSNEKKIVICDDRSINS